VKAEQKELSLEVKTCLSYMLLNPGTHGMWCEVKTQRNCPVIIAVPIESCLQVSFSVWEQGMWCDAEHKQVILCVMLYNVRESRYLIQ
jgi:hypothetical protein